MLPSRPSPPGTESARRRAGRPLGTLLLSALLLLPAALPAQERPPPPEVTHGPMLGRLTDTSVGVWVRTSRPAPVAVAYGTDPDRLVEVAASPPTELDHDNAGWVDLSGLRPDTLYYYEVRGPRTARASAELRGSFRTLPNADTYRDPRHNPAGRFNFAFEVGACNAQDRGMAAEMPAMRTVLDRHRGQIAFSIQNGDWIYEEQRDYPAAAWLAGQLLAPDAAPPVLRAAPVITGVWQNYKVYLERSANLRAFHRQIPAVYTFDDHELLGDVVGAGNVGLRDRRAVFRDIGIRGWSDYLGGANPRWHDDAIVFGRARFEAGSDILVDPDGRFRQLHPENFERLMVLWNEPTAAINEDKYDSVGGDPNAGVYAITEVLDDQRLRIRPAARATGTGCYSIGRPQYTSFRVGNCEFFLLDTRSYRQRHDRGQPFDPAVEFLGARQKRWLQEGMRRSDADFLFVVSSVSVMLPHLEAFPKNAEQENENDAWSAAGAERAEMLAFWESLGKPVLLLTGDLHHSFAVRIADRLWEFAAAPRNSMLTVSADAGNPPPNGRYRSLDRDVDIRWSTHLLPDVPRLQRYSPGYAVVQVNNIFGNPGADGGMRWITYPRPQVLVQFYDGLTGQLRYAESVLANPPPDLTP
ncbi:MAG: alkaline phosphatase D family protein [Opitutaceae bacterium]|nr:alkaline phosphatase D family protein [Opitutaceae bacterium]